MCVAMAALSAKIEVEGPGGGRTIPFAEFHRLPGADPSRDTTLREGELITAVTLPPGRFTKNAFYLKARDRNSYAFALVSVAAGLEMDGSMIHSAGCHGRCRSQTLARARRRRNAGQKDTRPGGI